MSSDAAKNQGALSPTLIAAAALGAGSFYLLGKTQLLTGTFTTVIGGSSFSGDTLRLILSGLVASLPALGGLLKDLLKTALVALGMNSQPQLDRVETVIADVKTTLRDGQLLIAEIAKTLGVKPAAQVPSLPKQSATAAGDATPAEAAPTAKTVA